MAQTTANFGFNIAEGTDVVNLLTQCYPNFTSLDSILQGIKETGVTVATDTKVGTVHQLVRTDSDCNMFRFIATGNYASGDTFTVDGNAVTATAMDGTSLPTGAFVINQSVVGILNGLVLTIVGVTGASSVAAQDVTYDNTGSGLTATNVQNAIDEVAGDIPTGFAATAITYDNTGSGLTATNAQDAIDELALGAAGYHLIAGPVYGNGTKTRPQLLSELMTGHTYGSNLMVSLNDTQFYYPSGDNEFTCLRSTGNTSLQLNTLSTTRAVMTDISGSTVSTSTPSAPGATSFFKLYTL